MPAAPSHRTPAPPTLQYFALGVIFAVSMLFQAKYASDIWQGEKLEIPFISPERASASLEVVMPAAEKLGFHQGDVLLALNGKKYTGSAVLGEAYARARVGDNISVSLRSGSERHTIEIPVTPASTSIGRIVFDILLNLGMPIGCILLGCWVVLVRPRDSQAWLLLGLLLCFSQLLSTFKIEGWGPGWREWAMGYHMALAQAWPSFMFLFGFFFPEPFPFWMRFGRWRNLIPWLAIAPPVACGIAGCRVAVLEMTDYAAAQPIYQHLLSWQTPQLFYAFCLVGFGFFASIFAKSGIALSADGKRRLRLLYWGTTVSTVPLFVLSSIAGIRGKTINTVAPDWLLGITLAMLALFPLTLAYVIVVQRAMDVRVVVRQGLKYALAKNGILILQATLMSAMAYLVMTLVRDRSVSLALKAGAIAIAVVAIWKLRKRGEQLRTWTDRRFFREAYNAEQVLSELSDQVRSIVETHSLIETVAQRISETMHIPRVAVLLGGAGPYRPAYALGYSASPSVVFAQGAGTVGVLQKQREPARVYLDDPDSWLYRETGVSEEDRSQLAQLGSELLLPLNARDQLLGFISLGPKRSDEPYSGSDLRLLKSVAAQTGLALENARLMTAIADEVAQRERLNREVEIAREVQERLFPQTLPPIRGIDYAGACRPALGVGGDYYDFLALPGGQLGIAIGDVSGKGIAAALTMASLQASLRGEASRMTDDLAALVSNVNRLVYEASSANRYATFFYGQYNPASRQLAYVNAGHNPPMLLHHSAGEWQLSRLETGGTVVGLLESFPYVQATVTIAPGDIFIAFTDGISEAMNAADEEWGEGRLVETIQRCTGLSPSEIITYLMQAADAFVAGAKQHDDMTLVVLHSQLEPSQ
jgi:sigma-B regulation protein RsbU (phosphoserine phosphatase)